MARIVLLKDLVELETPSVVILVLALVVLKEKIIRSNCRLPRHL